MSRDVRPYHFNKALQFMCCLTLSYFGIYKYRLHQLSYHSLQFRTLSSLSLFQFRNLGSLSFKYLGHLFTTLFQFVNVVALHRTGQHRPYTLLRYKVSFQPPLASVTRLEYACLHGLVENHASAVATQDGRTPQTSSISGKPRYQDQIEVHSES